MALIVNVKCVLTPHGPGHDVYGQPVAGTPVETKCGIVKLIEHREKTSVRADSSASRGTADETQDTAKLLFLPTTAVKIDDKVTVAGMDLRVTKVFPRYDLRGRLNHNEVDLIAWGLG